MNIFATDECPVKSARTLCDQHVIKMTLETAQMLCTVTGYGPYKPTHQNHPCVAWLREDPSNLDWLLTHGTELGREYTYRFHKEHKSADVISLVFAARYRGLEHNHTPFAQCVPDDLIAEGDPCEAYRACLVRKSDEWKSPMRWTKRQPPSWMYRLKWRANHTEVWSRCSQWSLIAAMR